MTEAEKQLLTGYLDGVLTAEEKERAEALLRSSSEAQQFFSSLMSDCLRLKYLRRKRLPADFADEVLASVRQELAQLSRQKLLRLRLRHWVPVAVAASVLLLVAWWTYALLSRLFTSPVSDLANAPQTLATQASPADENPTLSLPHGKTNVPADLSKWLQELGQLSGRASEGLWQSLAQALDPLQGAVTAAWSEMEPLVLGDWTPEVPKLAEPSVLTSPVRENQGNPFRNVDIHLPPIFIWNELDEATVQLIFQQGTFLVLDVSCREGERTWERIHQALRAQKIPARLDSRLKNMWMRRQSTVYFVYVENLTRTQVAQLLTALHREDVGLANKSSAEPLIRSLIVQPVDAHGRQHLAELLGIPTGLLPVPHPSAHSSTNAQSDIQDVQEDTLRKLKQLASGQSVRPPVTQAIVFSPLRYPPSKEIQAFRQQRGQLRPDGYHLVFLVRPER